MQIPEKLRWHAKFGLVVGVLFAAANSLPMITVGPAYYRERIGLPYLAVCALYLVGGVMTFLMLAILQDYAKSLVSYLVVGVLVAFPASAMTALALAKPEHPFEDMSFVAVVAAVVYGIIGGLISWFD
jgi:hypothetical protein